MPRALRPAASLLMLGLALGACKKEDEARPAAAAAPQRLTEIDLPEEGLVRQEVDLNADGKADVFTWFRVRTDGSRVPVRKEVDLNLDGKVDVFSAFDDKGVLKIEQMDGDFDGAVDWVDHYQSGYRVKAEIDSDHNGNVDTWYYYTRDDDKPETKPRIDRKERDTNGDGAVDVWERYDAAGNVVITARDLDGDGKMDEREE